MHVTATASTLREHAPGHSAGGGKMEQAAGSTKPSVPGRGRHGAPPGGCRYGGAGHIMRWPASDRHGLRDAAGAHDRRSAHDLIGLELGRVPAKCGAASAGGSGPAAPARLRYTDRGYLRAPQRGASARAALLP